MCDPVSLAIAAGLSGAGSALTASGTNKNAYAQAAASNAVLQQTLGQERGLEATNQGTLSTNLANYAPGAQDKQLADAQDARTATSTDNMTSSNPDSVPLAADPNGASSSDLAKRILAVHAGAVDRATLNGKVGGFGDTWLKNNLNTNAADRDIGVTNNYAEGDKAILAPSQTDAMAAAYQTPSLVGPALTAAGSIAAGAAGAGKSVTSLWSPAGVAAAGSPGLSLTNTGGLY